MPEKRGPSPPKDPVSPPSSSSASSEEEEGEGNHNTDPTSSQSPSKKPTSDLNQTPNSDSSTEEEEDDEEEEDAEDEKDVRSQSRPAQEKEVDEEEDSDESGSDSDSESASPPPNVKSARPSSGGADPNGKPISSEPMEGTPKPKKGASAESPAPKPSPQKRSAAPDSREKKSKKRQKPDFPKKPLFQRIWSTEDEVSVLKAMIKFVERGNVSSDFTGFHKFVKKSLSVDVTKNQVGEKMRRMKKKYQNLAKKAMKGKQPSFSNGGDNLVYEISKKLWGNEGECLENSKRSNNTVKPKSSPPSKAENHNHELRNIEALYPHLNDSLHSVVRVGGFRDVEVKRAITLMGDSRAKEWDERWMNLRLKEKKIYIERATLAYELVKELYDLDGSCSDLGMQHH